MMTGILGNATHEALVYLPAAVQVLALLVALVIVGKAVQGYRQNGSRPMLLLAVGLFLLVLVAPLFSTVAELVVGPFGAPVSGGGPSYEVLMVVLTVEHLLELAGLCSILASLYVRW
ncbi:DUF7521 family protein [Haloarchaeobius sp. HRN-SO-5]|uniref:DUF7521 family protein n=1 Tax=Haloarchaeobius sp. HRN-SO-5 TaxID=3446118 RepID=UPI003EB9A424